MPRATVPREGTRACASCGRPRGNVRNGWTPVFRRGESGEEVVAYTCPDCPTAAEPIRREVGKRGNVRFKATVRPPAGSPDGPKQRVSRCSTLDEARQFVESVLTGQDVAERRAEKLETACRRWLASRRDIRPITRDGYITQLAPVLRHIGHKPVGDLTVDHVLSLIAWMETQGGKRGQALGPRSVRAALIALRQVLDMLQEEGTVERNVARARAVRLSRVRTRTGTDLQHWRPDDLRQFVQHADTDDLAGAWRLTASGLTRADILGLRWSDVDMETGVVRISQGRVPLLHSDHVDDPKSGARRRAVPVETIWPGSLALLRSLRARQAADRLRAGSAWQESGYVVVDSLGRGVRPEWYGDRFRAVSRVAGVPTITLHSVRHSLAFWLHSLGVTPADAAALLGHTVEVHLSTYLPHSGASGINLAAQALGRAAAE